MTATKSTKFLSVIGQLMICLVAMVPGCYAQTLPNIHVAQVTVGEAKLVDEFGKLNSEDRSARFDTLFQELKQKPGSIGYVLIYFGNKYRYGEFEAHLRGIEIKTALRNFDRSRLVVINGGFKDTFNTELWVVGNGDIPPRPKPTLNIKYVVFTERGKYLIEAYDCCDDVAEIWKNYKP